MSSLAGCVHRPALNHVAPAGARRSHRAGLPARSSSGSSNLKGGDFRMPNARSLAAAVGCRARLAGRKKRRIAVAGAAIVAALAGSPMAGVPEASASTSETVIVTATGLLAPAAAVLGVGGTLLTQFHLIDGVEAVIPAAAEPVSSSPTWSPPAGPWLAWPRRAQPSTTRILRRAWARPISSARARRSARPSRLARQPWSWPTIRASPRTR